MRLVIATACAAILWLTCACDRHSDVVADDQSQSRAEETTGKQFKEKNMTDSTSTTDAEAVSYGQTALSPASGPANSLKLALVAGAQAGTPPLVLHGSYNLTVEIAGRYSSGLPAPIHVVAVSRKTGRVYIRNLAKLEDMPPRYLGESAPPSVVLEGPGGPSTKGISESGFFQVDLKRHLALPDESDVYDAFLWLEDVVSEIVTSEKPAEDGSRPGGLLFDRPASIATVTPAPRSSPLRLSLTMKDKERYISGRSGESRLSIVGYAIKSSEPGWTVLNSPNAGGMEFDFKLAAFLPKSQPDERILIFAITAGKRSELLDSNKH